MALDPHHTSHWSLRLQWLSPRRLHTLPDIWQRGAKRRLAEPGGPGRRTPGWGGSPVSAAVVGGAVVLHAPPPWSSPGGSPGGQTWAVDFHGRRTRKCPPTRSPRQSSSANRAIRPAGMANVNGTASAISWSPKHSKQRWWGSAPAIKPGHEGQARVSRSGDSMKV